MTIPGSRACEGPVIRQVLERVHLPSAMIPAQAPSEESFAVDAAASCSRPGPRLVEGTELLAHLMHPDRVPPPSDVKFEEVSTVWA